MTQSRITRTMSANDSTDAQRSGRPTFADLKTIFRVISHPKYRETCETLCDFLARSRTERENPDALLHLQVDMASLLLSLQRAKRRFEARAEDSSASEDLRTGALLAAATMRRLHHLVRQIGDGIAWRSFDYDRAALYQLARKPPTGHIEAVSTQKEVDKAGVHAANGTCVLMSRVKKVRQFPG